MDMSSPDASSPMKMIGGAFGAAATGASGVFGGIMGGQKRQSEFGDNAAKRSNEIPDNDAQFSWTAMRMMVQEIVNQGLQQQTTSINSKFSEQQKQIENVRQDVVQCKTVLESHENKINHIEQVMMSAVKTEVAAVKAEVESSMRSQSCGPLQRVAKGCEQNDADDVEASMKMQLRIPGKILRADYNVKVAQILQSVDLELAKLGAKVLGGVYKEKLDHTRITLKFNDEEDKNMCRAALIDFDDGYAPLASHEGKPVEVWRVDAKYVKGRQKKYFDGARMLARKLNLNFETDIDLNPKWDERTVHNKHTDTLIAYQDLETWELCEPKSNQG